MISKDFKQHWDWAASRGQFQQDYDELEHIYNLMKGCDCQSYLEVGSAEGNSLCILGRAVKINSHVREFPIEYIDIGEQHTTPKRRDAIDKLQIAGNLVHGYIGDSTDPETHPRNKFYDCVLIDGGHDFATVLSDSIMYAPLATKYIFWHDIQLPQVKMAVDWFVSRWKLGKYSTFINSPTFGFGIMEVDK